MKALVNLVAPVIGVIAIVIVAIFTKWRDGNAVLACRERPLSLPSSYLQSLAAWP